MPADLLAFVEAARVIRDRHFNDGNAAFGDLRGHFIAEPEAVFLEHEASEHIGPE